jgi:hypothetical protein
VKINATREPVPQFVPINMNIVVESKKELDILIGIFNVPACDIVRYTNPLGDDLTKLMCVQTQLYHKVIQYREK